MFENPEDFRTELRFEQFLFGVLITKAEVCKYVAATLFDLCVLVPGVRPPVPDIVTDAAWNPLYKRDGISDPSELSE